MTAYGPDHDAQAGQQADADWVHSPAWTAYHDEIDQLQVTEQHEEALAENANREAGQ